MKRLHVLFILSFFLFAFLGLSINVSAQKRKIDLQTDTLEGGKVAARKYENRKILEGKGRKKVTESVSFNVEALKDLLDRLSANKVPTIIFQFAVLREEDVEAYAMKHPKQKIDDAKKRDDLIGRQTLLIKVPTAALVPPVTGSSANNGGTDVGGQSAPMGAEATYLDLGSICPPPGQCDGSFDIEQ